jgi:L-ascorbate metabolism protein UlaG (beta-lactamase superfamily)
MKTEWRLTWHGHATWSVDGPDARLLIDPFLDANPAAKSKGAVMAPSHMLISHGHADHVADAASIAARTGCQVLANFEIASWLSKHHGVQNSIGMNHGGSFNADFFRATLVPAIHSSSLPDGSYGGTAGGWVIELPTAGPRPYRLYFAGDTCVFGDMRWIARRGIDGFIVPIGDLFTMGPEDSLEAIDLVQPTIVFPSHYNTWPPIAQDVQAWAASVRERTGAQPIVPQVDQPIVLELP